MSYDINIVDKDGETIEIDQPHEIHGGTYAAEILDTPQGRIAVPRTQQLTFNITYNYSKFYYKHLDAKLGIRWLYDQQVKDTIPKLLETIIALEKEEKTFVYQVPETIPALITDDGTEIIPEREPPGEKDYWAPTPRNAKKALQDLVALAAFAPEGFWSGD